MTFLYSFHSRTKSWKHFCLHERAIQGLCPPPKPSVSFVPCPCLAPTDSRDRRFPFGARNARNFTPATAQQIYINTWCTSSNIRSLMIFVSKMILFFVQWYCNHYFTWNDIVPCRTCADSTVFFRKDTVHIIRLYFWLCNSSCRWLACLASCSVSFVSYRAEKLKQSFVEGLLLSCTTITICLFRNPYEPVQFIEFHKRGLNTAHEFKQGASWLHVISKNKLDPSQHALSFNSIFNHAMST